MEHFWSTFSKTPGYGAHILLLEHAVVPLGKSLSVVDTLVEVCGLSSLYGILNVCRRRRRRQWRRFLKTFPITYRPEFSFNRPQIWTQHVFLNYLKLHFLNFQNFEF